MIHEHESPDTMKAQVQQYLSEAFPKRELGQTTPEDARLFLEAINNRDLGAVRRMVQSNRDLIFVADDFFGGPARPWTAVHTEVADYLAHVKLQRLREGSIPETLLYGAIHDLGEAAHSETGYRGCENFRIEAAPVVAGFLAHDDPMIRYVAVSVLATHWDMKHYVQTFEQMGLRDPDEYVRHISVSNIGWLLRGSRDRSASRFLLAIFRNPVQLAWIREAAYDALVMIWRGFDAADALFVRKLRERQLRRAETERAGSGVQAEPLSENAWEKFIDWIFVAQVEQEVKEEGSP